MSEPDRIIVTGASSGIGAALVSRLRGRGLRVVAIDVRAPEVEVEEFVKADLSDLGAIEASLAGLAGPFAALCNVAGVPPRDGNAAAVLNVNFFALRRVTQALLPSLKEGASIVNVASRAGENWRANIGQVKALAELPDDVDAAAICAAWNIDATRAYALSKEAVIVWTMASAHALGQKGIRMNCVSPAAVATPILGDFRAAFGDNAVSQNLARVGRPGQPEEIAAVLDFLASVESRWLNGANIPIDGGLTAQLACDELGVANVEFA